MALMDSTRDQAIAAVAKQLLSQAKLSAREIETRITHALNPDYWRQLNPALGLARRSELPAAADAAAVFASQAEQFVRAGYFQTAPFMPLDFIARLKAAVDTVRQNDWPAVFVYVYDEFWQVARSEPIKSLLQTLLGDGYRQSCHVWGHCVQARDGAAGWRPHIDNPRTPGRVTIWIALTDATLDNGCIYLIPKNRAPVEIDSAFRKAATVDKKIVNQLLQNSRALPALAGSVLGWGSGVIHWGSACHGVGAPRLAISQEFFAASATPSASEKPVFDCRGELPTLTERLEVIAKAIVNYQRFEPLLVRYQNLAEELLRRTKPNP
jgi:ectoine hydroxylase-related dioxygenase (phytanoyl-CoA dioxygenase family)